jgi:hypothetical protein
VYLRHGADEGCPAPLSGPVWLETSTGAVSKENAYFDPYERGAGSAGQAFVALSEEQRRAVRKEVRRGLGDAGGPVKIEVEIRFASGRK